MQWNMDHSRHNIRDVAAGYDALPKFDPRAAYAWKHLAQESKKHADYIKQYLNVTETDDPEPYDTSEDMIRDIRNNRNFIVSTANADHPIWTPEDNINFRIVHDVFGHAATDGDFGWHGENDACSTHFALSSPHAQKALATECLGQTGYAIDRGGFTDQRVGFIPGLHEGLVAANKDTPIPTQAQLMQRALYGPPKQSNWKLAEKKNKKPSKHHTDLSEYKKSLKKYGPLKTHNVKKWKKKGAMSPEDHRDIFEYENPYMYHGVNVAQDSTMSPEDKNEIYNLIMKNGILPRTQTGSTFGYQGFWESRPNHVYVGHREKGIFGDEPPIFRIDMRKIDPKKIKPDEDYVYNEFYGDRVPQSPEEDRMSHPTPINHKDWAYDQPTLGEWMEQNAPGTWDDEHHTKESYHTEQSLAVEEGIPADAININPEVIENLNNTLLRRIKGLEEDYKFVINPELREPGSNFWLPHDAEEFINSHKRWLKDLQKQRDFFIRHMDRADEEDIPLYLEFSNLVYKYKNEIRRLASQNPNKNLKEVEQRAANSTNWKIAESQDANRMYRQHTDGTPVAETTFESIQNEDTSEPYEDEYVIINGKKWKKVRRKNNPQPDNYKDPIGGWGFYSKLIERMESQPWVVVSVEKAKPIDVNNLVQYPIPRSYKIVDQLVPHFARYGVIPIARKFSNTVEGYPLDKLPEGGGFHRDVDYTYNHNIHLYDPETQQIVYGMEYSLNHPDAFEHHSTDEDGNPIYDNFEWAEQEFYEHKYPTYVTSIHYNQPGNHEGAQDPRFHDGGRIYLSNLDEKGKPTTVLSDYQETVDNFNKRYPRLSLSVLRWMQQNLPKPIGADIINPKLKEKAQKQDFVTLSKWKISVPPAEKAKEFSEGYEQSESPLEIHHKYPIRGHKWQLIPENFERLYQHPDWPLKTKYTVNTLTRQDIGDPAGLRPIGHWEYTPMGEHHTPGEKKAGVNSGAIYINPFLSPEAANETLWHELQHAYQHQEKLWTPEMKEKYINPLDFDDSGMTDEEIKTKIEEYHSHPMELDANLFADFMRKYPLIEESEPYYSKFWVPKEHEKDPKAIVDEYYREKGSKRRLRLPSIKSKWIKKSTYLPGFYSTTLIPDEENGGYKMILSNDERMTHWHIHPANGTYPDYRGIYNPEVGQILHLSSPEEYSSLLKGDEYGPQDIMSGPEAMKATPEEHEKVWQEAAAKGVYVVAPTNPDEFLGGLLYDDGSEGRNLNVVEKRNIKVPDVHVMHKRPNHPEEFKFRYNTPEENDEKYWSQISFSSPAPKPKQSKWIKKEAPARSKAQYRYMQGICNGSIEPPEGMTRAQACEYVEGQSSKGLPEKKSHWVEGYHAAVLDPRNKKIYVSDSPKGFHSNALADNGYRGWPEEAWRGLYNPETQDLVHMSSPHEEEHPAFWEILHTDKMLHHAPSDYRETWLGAAENQGLPVSSVRVMTHEGDNAYDLPNSPGDPGPESNYKFYTVYDEEKDPKEQNTFLSKIAKQEKMEKSLIKMGFSEKAAVVIALDYISKLSYWIDGYHAAVALRDPETDVWHMDVGFSDKLTHGGVTADYINDLGTRAMREAVADKNSRTDYYNYHTARGLYNPTTKDFIHMSHPDFWDETDYNFKSLDQDERDRMEAFWKQLAQQNGVELDSIRVLNNQTGHIEDLSIADFEMPEEVNRERRMRERNRPLTPWEREREGYDTKTGKTKTSHWIQGFQAAIINQEGQLEIAAPDKEILDEEGNVIDVDDTPWYATHWDIGGYPHYRGLYNHDTGELIHMTSPKEHEKLRGMGSEYLNSTDDAVNPLEHETIWREAAKKSNIPISDFKLLYEKEEDEHGDDPPYKRWSDPMNQKEDFNLVDPEEFMPKQSKWKKKSHWLEGYYAAVITPKREMKVAKEWTQFHGSLLPDTATLSQRGFHRGLYNKETGQLLHMTTPEEWKKLENSWGDYEGSAEERWPIGFEWFNDPKHFISPYKTEKEWLRASENSKIPVSEVKFFSGEPEVSPFAAFDVNNFNIHSPDDIAQIRMSKWKVSKKDAWEAVLDGELGHDIITTGTWKEVKKQTIKWLKQLKDGYINKKNPHDNKKIDSEAKEQDSHALEDLKLYEEKKRWSFHFDHGKYPYDLIIQPVGYKESKWKKRSHWVEGFHAAVITKDGHMFVADDPHHAHVQSMPEKMIGPSLINADFWRGLYHPETHTILHMSTPEEYKELRAEGSEIAPSHSETFKKDHDYYDEGWRRAAEDAGIPVKDVKLLKWNSSESYPTWDNKRYPNDPEQFIIQDLNLPNKFSKWKVSDKKKKKIHPKFQTSLKEHQQSVRKYGPLKTHKVRNFKKKSVLNEQQAKELFAEDPYMYHDVSAARSKSGWVEHIPVIDSIFKNGILPKEQTGIAEYDDWLTSRPDHVYIGKGDFYSKSRRPALRIDMSKVDPSTLAPDEDLFPVYGYNNNYSHLIDFNNIKSPPFEQEQPQGSSLGDWMHGHPHLDTPKNVKASKNLIGSVAVNGGVPADAIHYNPEWLEDVMNDIDITIENVEAGIEDENLRIEEYLLSSIIANAEKVPPEMLNEFMTLYNRIHSIWGT